MGDLDRQEWAKVEGLLLNPDVIGHELERLEAEDSTTEDLDGIDRSIARVQSRRRNFLAQLGDLDPEDVRWILKETGQRLKELVAERSQVLGQREARRQARQRLADLETWCGTVAANLGEMTYDQRRTAMTAQGLCVNVWRKEDRLPRVDASIPLGDVTKINTSSSAADATNSS